MSACCRSCARGRACEGKNPSRTHSTAALAAALRRAERRAARAWARGEWSASVIAMERADRLQATLQRAERRGKRGKNPYHLTSKNRFGERPRRRNPARRRNPLGNLAAGAATGVGFALGAGLVRAWNEHRKRRRR
jgi:hypothetical protein